MESRSLPFLTSFEEPHEAGGTALVEDSAVTEPLSDRLREILSRVEESARSEPSEEQAIRIRLAATSDDELSRLARDRNESSVIRRTSLTLLVDRHRTDLTTSALLIELLDDPDPTVALEAMDRALPFDAKMLGRLHEFLDDPREAYWSGAARALARRKDRAVISRLLDWFQTGDRSKRRVAFACFDWVLRPMDRRVLLAHSWERGGRDDEDRVMLAEGLLALGDRRGVAFLEEVSRREADVLSNRAASILREHPPSASDPGS